MILLWVFMIDSSSKGDLHGQNQYLTRWHLCAYDELIISGGIFSRTRNILVDLKEKCDSLGTELFDFQLVYILRCYDEYEQYVKCRVRRLGPYYGSFIAKVGDLFSREPPVALIEVAGRNFCVLGRVPCEPRYMLRSVLTVRDLAGGGPAVEEIEL